MSQNSDFKDLLNALSAAKAKYLIIGGHAVMLYSEPRFTKDLDLWVEPSDENSPLVYRAPAAFGAPLAGIGAWDFAKEDVIYQIGMPPSRVDILTSVAGLVFDEAWQKRVAGEFAGVSTFFISLDHLLANKRAVDRAVDRVDVERLEEARETLKRMDASAKL